MRRVAIERYIEVNGVRLVKTLLINKVIDQYFEFINKEQYKVFVTLDGEYIKIKGIDIVMWTYLD